MEFQQKESKNRKQVLIIKARNIKTGEVIEGTLKELSEILHKTEGALRQASNINAVMSGEWEMNRISDQEEILKHYKRIGLYKKCKVCGKEFIADRITTVYCCKACTEEGHRIKCREGRYPSAQKKKEKKLKVKKKTLLQCSKEADKARLSYGQLEAQKWMKKNHIVRRSK